MQHLALRIYKGTHGAPPDEHPLVSVGAVPDTFCPVVPTLVDEPEIWVLVHRYDYTLYVYQVTQEDTTYRQICLLVPAGIRLSADNNPYGLLLELWGILESQGNQHALFEERLVLSIIGKQVSDMRLPVMDGQQPASFCADSRMQVKALLMFSQYPQLARVSRLEIGLHCTSTISLPIKANVKKVVQPESVHQPKPEKPQAEPSVSEETQEEQTDRRRNVRKKVALYAFLLVAAIAIIGFEFDTTEDSSDTSNYALSTDTIVAEEKPFITEEKPDDREIALEKEAEKIKQSVQSSVFSDETKREAEALDAEKREKREQIRTEILSLVNQKDLQSCRNHTGWKYLTIKERMAIETILYYLNGKFDEDLSSSSKKKIKQLIYNNLPFHSLGEIIKVRNKIIDIKYDERKERIINKKSY